MTDMAQLARNLVLDHIRDAGDLLTISEIVSDEFPEELSEDQFDVLAKAFSTELREIVAFLEMHFAENPVGV